MSRIGNVGVFFRCDNTELVSKAVARSRQLKICRRLSRPMFLASLATTESVETRCTAQTSKTNGPDAVSSSRLGLLRSPNGVYRSLEILLKLRTGGPPSRAYKTDETSLKQA